MTRCPPSASEAGCAEYLEELVAQTADIKKKLAKSFASVDSLSRKQFGQSFLRLSRANRVEVLRKLEAAEAPVHSVVNAWHRAHDVRNLFLVDGSSFTTSAAVNPTSTIGALALRCTDGIWERRRDWE